MAINFDKWIQEYETSYQGNSIRYKDDSGTWQDDKTPRLTSVSTTLQSKGYISRPTLREIGRWKVQSNRIDRWLKANSSQEVELRSAAAFHASKEEDAIKELTELKGVGVPVASTILTMYDPTQYAVIDFRVLRALGAVQPHLTDPNNYSKYADFLDHYRGYGTRSKTYGFYMDEVRRISSKEKLSSREVDMALWAFDESI